MSEPTTDTQATLTTETAPAAPPEWMGKIDEPIRNVFAAKGWADPDPVAALAKVGGAYVNAEKLIGAEKLPLPPKGADGKRDFANWDGWKALGVPEKPDAYAFAKPEGFDGYSDDMAGAFRGIAHKARLTPEQAAIVHDAYVGMARSGVALTKAEAEKQLESLRVEWGAEYAAKAAQARAGATPALEAAGLTGDDFDKIGNAIGHDKAVKMFQHYGASMGEDRHVETDQRQPGDPRDPAAAMAEINRLRGGGDAEFSAAYLNKNSAAHKDAVARMARLHAIAYPEQAA